MNLREATARHPLRAAIVFQGALIPLAFLLAAWLEVPLLARFQWTGGAMITGIAATLPMLGLLGLLALSDLRAYQALAEQIRDFLWRLFHGAPPGAVALVALFAGLGEELLMRGVLQGWLAGHLPIEWAILLTALVFGLAHFISGFYFLFATLIGIWLGVVYHLTGNLLVVVLAHALYDWIVIRIYLRSAG
ncbi:CPBP family intramembrane glutamic endopeptidase [Thioalkalivibrio sp.]|uniref:CPBP family intramembrane glutamic endopeptidase n=1 Tax=Thioalkalivibrio sp. TaxID=2093813 RepID=UPI0039757C47